MRYEIIFSPQAEEDIATLKASDRAKAFDANDITAANPASKLFKDG